MTSRVSAIVSCCLLLAFPGSTAMSVVLMLLSVFVSLAPQYFLPIIAVASVSSIFDVFGCAAMFVYLALFVLSLVARSRQMRFPDKRLLTVIGLFGVWTFVCCMNSVSGQYYPAVRLSVIMLLIVFCSCVSNMRSDSLLRAFTTVIPYCLVVCLVKLLVFPKYYVIEGTYVDIIRLSLFEDMNPNEIALFVALCCVASFIESIQSRRFRMLLVPVIGLIVLFVLKSRTSFYSSIVICSIYFVCSYRIKVWKKVGLLVMIATLAYGLISLLPDDSNMSEREMTLVSILDDSGSGRFDTWIILQNIIPQHLGTGIGLGRENYKKLGLDYDADNLYFDLMAETGIAGTVIFLLMTVLLFVSLARIRSDMSSVARYAIGLMLVCGIGETLFDSQIFWYVIFMALLCIRADYTPKADTKGPKRRKYRLPEIRNHKE